MASTNYFIERNDFGSFINFTDGESGGITKVATSSQIEVEYTGIPTDLALNSNIDDKLANLVMWKVMMKLFTVEEKSRSYSMAENSAKAQRKLAIKSKNLHSSDFTVRQWDY